MKKGAVAGILMICAGLALFAYYDRYVKPENEARELNVEGRMILERGTTESLNQAISVFTRVVAKYPDTEAADEAYYLIALGYEKLGLNRLAYIKYIYLLKNNPQLGSGLKTEIRTRIARLNILKSQTEEGTHQLMNALADTDNPDMRSRIYSELGHSSLKSAEYARAKRMFDIALRENGHNEEAIIGKARAFKHLGEDSKAYDLYEYFLKYYGSFSRYEKDVKASYLNQIYQSGISSFKKGAYYASIEFFKRMIGYFPGDKKTENGLYWIGENFFALKKYESAISYFNRVLSNSYFHKDEDARIKCGYSYFLADRFDLAAREFQTYLRDYPGGKHADTARKWKEMSTKEILYRIEDGMADSGETEEDKSIDDSDYGEEPVSSQTDGVSGENISVDSGYENVAEL